MSEAADECFKVFNVVIKKIGSRDLIQEALAYNIYPTQTRWKLSKEVKSTYKTPSAGWLKFVEEKCNEISGSYLAREHEDMRSAFCGQGKL
jgi:hypothetical protein